MPLTVKHGFNKKSWIDVGPIFNFCLGNYAKSNHQKNEYSVITGICVNITGNEVTNSSLQILQTFWIFSNILNSPNIRNLKVTN